MPAIRMSSKPAEITPEQRRDKIIAILAAGLVRLIRSADTLGESLGEKLSESSETGLELPGETRLSVVAG